MKKNENVNIFESASFPTERLGSLAGRYNQAWTEESFYFEKKIGRQRVLKTKSDHLSTSLNKIKARRLFSFLLLVFVLIFARIFYLQIFRGGQLRATAEANRQRLLPIAAERGLIFDRNNIQLTDNIPNFSLAVVPQDLPRNSGERQAIINKLSELTGKSEAEIKSILDEYGSYSYESIIVEENIDYNTALKILIGSADLPGIQIQRGSKRLYLNDINNLKSFSTSTPSSFSHIIGYIGKLSKNELDKLHANGYLPSDNIGKTGLEKSYETILRGTYGRRRIEVNAAGKEQTVLAEEAPIAGQQLRLSIDAKMQSALEKILADNLKSWQKQRGSAIIMDPQNGEILAMVSLPAYDNNDFSGGIIQEQYKKYIEDFNHPLFNRAIAGTYPSGSSIKPAIASGGLQEGIITSATVFRSTGGLQVGSWFFPDWQAGGHGLTDVRKSLAWSVNTFYYYLGGGYGNFVGMGVEKIVNYLKLFGFSQLTGIDLPGEQAGFLPSKQWKEETKKEKWYIGDTYNVSIGQGDILVTPLQIANMTCAIANRGTLYVPHFVKTLIDPISKVETPVNPVIIRQNFINKNNLSTVALGMHDCVVYGSCRRLSLLNLDISGKTGTAQWNSNKDNHAWFTSFAPFNSPQIVVTVMVEEGREGSSVSEQVAFDFYRWWGHYSKK